MQKTISLFLLLGLCCLVAGSAISATIIVPTDQPTIAAAIAAATSGDTISVNPGTYVNDSIAIVDKSLTIIGNGARPIVTLGPSASPTDVSAGKS